MTSLLRLRLRRLDQLDKMPLAYPKRVVAPGNLDPRHAVVVNPDNFTGQDYRIAYSGSVGGVRGSFSHGGDCSMTEETTTSEHRSSSPLDMSDDNLPCFVAIEGQSGIEWPGKALSYRPTERGYFYSVELPDGGKIEIHALWVRPISDDEYQAMALATKEAK